ncbi:MAG: ATP-binding protein [Thermoplasmata archaeon]|nr:ATP-binding protein [Thermoplasmata archaeon]
MRRGTRTPAKIRIGVKLGVGFAAVLILLSGLTILTLSITEATIMDEIEEREVSMASASAFTIDRTILRMRSELEFMATDSEVQTLLFDTNAYFYTLPDVDSYIGDADRNWTSIPFNETSPFMYSILNNSLSAIIRDRLVDKAATDQGFEVYTCAFLANEYGATVAMSDKTAKYVHNDEWWTITIATGHYIGDMTFDEDSQSYGISVCTRIDDPNGTVMGVLKGVVNLLGIVRGSAIELTPTPYISREFMILNSAGELLYSTDPYKRLENWSDREVFTRAVGHDGSFVANVGGRDVLCSYSHSVGCLDFTGFGWVVIIGYNNDEVLAPANELSNVVIPMTVLLLAIGGGVAYFTLRSVSKPIQELIGASRAIAAGDLDGHIDVTTRDEIGELADTFNEMVSNLKEYRDDLEGKIKDRTMELAKTNEDLKRSNDELQQFAYVASHDLQEPLRMIASYMELLSRRYVGKLDKDADEFIGFAVDGANRLQRMINDLLVFSRIETKGKPFVRVDCNEILNESIQNLKMAIEDSGAVITSDPLPTTAFGDESQLTMLFQNLLGNAVKFRGEEAPRIHVSAERRTGEWMFTVSDNGIGIAPEYSERIFAVFQRLHAGPKHSGPGIGLAICKKIVERHGGRIWTESEPGKGSRFNFTLQDLHLRGVGARQGDDRGDVTHPAG